MKLLLGSSVLAVCLLGEVSQITGGVRADAAVTIRTFKFRPDTLDVKVGTTVMWTNDDEIDHTVTSGVPDSADGRFNFTLATKGTRASTTFDRVGVTQYFCAKHSFMRGVVRVR